MHQTIQKIANLPISVSNIQTYMTVVRFKLCMTVKKKKVKEYTKFTDNVLINLCKNPNGFDYCSKKIFFYNY